MTTAELASGHDGGERHTWNDYKGGQDFMISRFWYKVMIWQSKLLAT